MDLIFQVMQFQNQNTVKKIYLFTTPVKSFIQK